MKGNFVQLEKNILQKLLQSCNIALKTCGYVYHMNLISALTPRVIMINDKGKLVCTATHNLQTFLISCTGNYFTCCLLKVWFISYLSDY